MNCANRLAALEAVAEAAREYHRAHARAGQVSHAQLLDTQSALSLALSILDAIPAQGQGETIKVAVAHNSQGMVALWMAGPDWLPPPSPLVWTHIGTTLLPICVEGGGE